MKKILRNVFSFANQKKKTFSLFDGFSIIELLVVVAIGGVFTAFLALTIVNTTFQNNKLVIKSEIQRQASQLEFFMRNSIANAVNVTNGDPTGMDFDFNEGRIRNYNSINRPFSSELPQNFANTHIDTLALFPREFGVNPEPSVLQPTAWYFQLPTEETPGVFFLDGVTQSGPGLRASLSNPHVTHLVRLEVQPNQNSALSVVSSVTIRAEFRQWIPNEVNWCSHSATNCTPQTGGSKDLVREFTITLRNQELDTETFTGVLGKIYFLRTVTGSFL